MKITKFFKAFIYAGQGIVHAFRTERNFKFHTFAAVIVVCVGFIVGLSIYEWLIILLLIGGMLALEALNAAIERVVDLVTQEHHPLAKQAKDLAAGAVLLFSIASAIIGLLLFIPKFFTN